MYVQETEQKTFINLEQKTENEFNLKTDNI